MLIVSVIQNIYHNIQEEIEEAQTTYCLTTVQNLAGHDSSLCRHVETDLLASMWISYWLTWLWVLSEYHSSLSQLLSSIAPFPCERLHVSGLHFLELLRCLWSTNI